MAYPTKPIYKLVKDLKGNISTIKKQIGETEPYKTLHIPINTNNRYYKEYLEWKAIDGNEPEAADTETLTWDSIRSTRDQILRNTDWTMTTGATVDQAQWAAYRQNIRDIPQTYKDQTPDDVVWPTQPSTAGPNT